MPQPSLKIDRARYVVSVDDHRRIIRDGSILIENGRISRVGRADELAQAPADRVIDARHFVVTPGVVNGRMHGRLRAWAMPFSPETCSAELLRGLKRVVGERGTGLTLHHGSGPQARKDYQGRGAKNPTEYLEALGVLGPNVLLAHALGLDDAEVDCVARTGAAVTMCPVTAAKGARGATALGRMPALLARCVRVALGCDSPNNSNHLDPGRP